jgi:hypothetical protein
VGPLAPRNGAATAYVCVNHACRLPVTDRAAFDFEDLLVISGGEERPRTILVDCKVFRHALAVRQVVGGEPGAVRVQRITFHRVVRAAFDEGWNVCNHIPVSHETLQIHLRDGRNGTLSGPGAGTQAQSHPPGQAGDQKLFLVRAHVACCY